MKVIFCCFFSADPNIACGIRGEGRVSLSEIILEDPIYFIFNLFDIQTLQTPLHICAEYGFVNNVQLLLSYKAALITKDISGLTAFDIAENGDHINCAQLLKETAGELDVNFNVNKNLFKCIDIRMK